MRVGSGIRIQPRFFSPFLVSNGRPTNVLLSKNSPKRQDPSQMISHIKNISVGLWLHKRETHIQYPNMYKLYVSCNYIHKDYWLSRRPKHQHSVRAAPGMRALDRTAAQSAQYRYSPKKKKSKVCLMVGSSAPSWGVFMQRCNVKN